MIPEDEESSDQDESPDDAGEGTSKGTSTRRLRARPQTAVYTVDTDMSGKLRTIYIVNIFVTR